MEEAIPFRHLADCLQIRQLGGGPMLAILFLTWLEVDRPFSMPELSDR